MANNYFEYTCARIKFVIQTLSRNICFYKVSSMSWSEAIPVFSVVRRNASMRGQAFGSSILDPTYVARRFVANGDELIKPRVKRAERAQP
jgi:hypothetical protein